MSQNEIHKGKLKLIHTAPSEDEAYAYLKNLILQADPSVAKEFENGWWVKEQIYEAIYESEILEDIYYIVGNKVYEDIDHVELEYGFTDFKKNEDGTISYFTMFYNGGGCLSEVIESGLKNEYE